MAQEIEEIWKDIPYHPGYQASNLGNIKSLPFVRQRGFQSTIDKGRVLRQFRNKNWPYMYTNISGLNKKTVRVHRVIAKTFIPNPLNLPEVNHKNGIGTDNRVENLEWVTSQRNTKHSFDIGRKPSFGHRKLSDNDIFDVRYLYYCGASTTTIAKEYNLHISTIQNLVKGKTWKHV